MVGAVVLANVVAEHLEALKVVLGHLGHVDNLGIDLLHNGAGVALALAPRVCAGAALRHDLLGLAKLVEGAGIG